MAWEENSRSCLHMQLIAILSRIGVIKMKKVAVKFGGNKKCSYLCNRLQEVRAFSSAGLEHLPYKQRVGGSNPSTPTKGCFHVVPFLGCRDFFCLYISFSSLGYLKPYK